MGAACLSGRAWAVPQLTSLAARPWVGWRLKGLAPLCRPPSQGVPHAALRRWVVKKRAFTRQWVGAVHASQPDPAAVYGPAVSEPRLWPGCAMLMLRPSITQVMFLNQLRIQSMMTAQAQMGMMGMGAGTLGWIRVPSLTLSMGDRVSVCLFSPYL